MADAVPVSGAASARDSAGAPRQAPRRFGVLRRAAVRAIESTMVFAGGARFYRRVYLAPGRFRVRHEALSIRGLAPGLAGFRIAHMSDFHAGPFVRRGSLTAVVEAIGESGAQVVCMTGDYVTHAWEEALELLPDFQRLAELPSVERVIGVFGNHDYRGRNEGRIQSAFASVGVQVLRNESARHEHGDGAVTFVGLEDLEESKSIDVEGARAGVRDGDVEIALCHNPLGAPALARAGCAAVLSGHTHGHQIDLPIVRRAAPSHPGDRIDRGETACVTTNGVGALGVPVRLFAPAEVVVLTLQGAERAEA